MQHFKHAILQQNISILIHQFGAGFFMKGTVRLIDPCVDACITRWSAMQQQNQQQQEQQQSLVAGGSCKHAITCRTLNGGAFAQAQPLLPQQQQQQQADVNALLIGSRHSKSSQQRRHPASTTLPCRSGHADIWCCCCYLGLAGVVVRQE
jgi:hypothetical protein